LIFLYLDMSDIKIFAVLRMYMHMYRVNSLLRRRIAHVVAPSCVLVHAINK
jgi:hypothetical protein